ncbi:polysaccharide pyruvyl transferase family protein [Halalkalibacterium ligniniphilum]|uniref:polysaccharide pyruvyl transferase family protein n=1 Tax=Halalkalibacterium ligniniphilum TaxID=1134413 RepID=UPI00034AE1C8|nr:polysaccharide pyruvyl transferase family protein [Halalkalibacterium ligniniphilum]
MKISIITTVNHNIGDDFVREGIVYLLNKHYKSKKLSFVNIHKHSPITSRDGFEKVRSNRIGAIIDRFLPLAITSDKILKSDLVVQSGAPVYWSHDGGPHCSENEWYTPLIRRRYSKLSAHVPLLNLAAGSCQKYHSDGSDFLYTKDIEYVKEFESITSVTTLRDSLSKKILNNIGLDAPVIPCSSIFAKDNLNITQNNSDYVALNFMKNGAHFTFGQKIDSVKWWKTFKEFYEHIKNKENCVFVCHNNKEVEEAKKIDSNAQIFISNNYIDYVKFYSKAKFGIMNRVHGAFMIASFGRPSFVIGNDSRAVMAEEIGLKHGFVADMTIEGLVNEYEYLKEGADNFVERFQEIKEKAFNDYMKALGEI